MVCLRFLASAWVTDCFYLFVLTIHNHSLLLNSTTISTGERPLVDILQDCRYWVIHVITIPALFLSGVVCVASGILFNVAGTANWLDYFSFVTSLSLLNDRFSLGIFV